MYACDTPSPHIKLMQGHETLPNSEGSFIDLYYKKPVLTVKDLYDQKPAFLLAFFGSWSLSTLVTM